MRTLEKPKYDAGWVYDVCISRVKDQELKGRLAGVRHMVLLAAASYDSLATQEQLYRLSFAPPGPGVTSEELVKVYTERMAQKSSPGRAVYDGLMLAPGNGICPFCGHRIVSTLDHFLPKRQFSLLAVTPVNLVAACQDCNKVKSEGVASVPEQQVLHPYYDKWITAIRWLKATIEPGSPPSIAFMPVVDAWVGDVYRSRIGQHFERFGLARLYAVHAAQELVQIRAHLNRLHEIGGMVAVQADLASVASSRLSAHQNSWQGAMYEALAGSAWFCEHGFKDIPSQ